MPAGRQGGPSCALRTSMAMGLGWTTLHTSTTKRIAEQPITAHLAEFLKGYIDAAEPEQGWLFPSRSEAGQRSTTRSPG
jgi:hypothetical protein